MKSPQLQALNRVLSRARRDPRQKPEDVELLKNALQAMHDGKEPKAVWGLTRPPGRPGSDSDLIAERNAALAWAVAELVHVHGMTVDAATRTVEKESLAPVSAKQIERVYFDSGLHRQRKGVRGTHEQDATPIPPISEAVQPTADEDFYDK